MQTQAEQRSTMQLPLPVLAKAIPPEQLRAVQLEVLRLQQRLEQARRKAASSSGSSCCLEDDARERADQAGRPGAGRPAAAAPGGACGRDAGQDREQVSSWLAEPRHALSAGTASRSSDSDDGTRKGPGPQCWLLPPLQHGPPRAARAQGSRDARQQQGGAREQNRAQAAPAAAPSPGKCEKRLSAVMRLHLGLPTRTHWA
jgi:hypothetical protein